MTGRMTTRTKESKPPPAGARIRPSSEGLEGPPAVERCPACGQPQPSPPPARCDLCQTPLDEAQLIGEDTTPYARERRWFRMCEWVWFAGAPRLLFLSRVRASSASRGFAVRNLLLLAAAAAFWHIVQLDTRAFGWLVQPAANPPPGGGGWIHLARSSLPPPATASDPVPMALYWNIVMSAIVCAVTFAATLTVGAVALALTGWGVRAAHGPGRRNQPRLGGALHYGTAWLALSFVCSLIVLMRPIARMGALREWWWPPPEIGVLMTAASLILVVVIMTWLWGLRLAGCAPPAVRRRVLLWLGLGVPLLCAALGASTHFGLAFCFARLLERLG